MKTITRLLGAIGLPEALMFLVLVMFVLTLVVFQRPSGASYEAHCAGPMSDCGR